MLLDTTNYWRAIYQGELEHRTSKVRYPRTSGRAFTLQLSKIERRQRQIRQIRQKMDSQQAHKLRAESHDDEASNSRLQYNIGKNQNSPLHLPTFLQRNEGDPALKVRLLLCPLLSSCTDPNTFFPHRTSSLHSGNIYFLKSKIS